MVSIKDTNLAQEKFCIKLQMLSFIGSVLMIVIIMQGRKRVKTCWLNYIIGTVLIKALYIVRHFIIFISDMLMIVKYRCKS